MAQNCLHHDFVLDFCEELIRDVGVEDFLDSNWCAIQQSFVNDRETALADLLTHFNVAHLDFSDAWHSW